MTTTATLYPVGNGEPTPANSASGQDRAVLIEFRLPTEQEAFDAAMKAQALQKAAKKFDAYLVARGPSNLSIEQVELLDEIRVRYWDTFAGLLGY